VTSTVDVAGQRWMLYHAVDRTDPYVAGAGTYTKRPVLMDRLDWRDGWPVVRGGAGPSDTPQPAPVVTPGQAGSSAPTFVTTPALGPKLPAFSDEFGGHAMDPAWTWLRDPGAATRAVAGGVLRWQTQQADLGPDPGAAGLPLRPLPSGDFTVETRVSSTVPRDGCCQNYAQGGLVVYQDDADFVKLTVTSIWETRQTEFGKRETAEGPGYPTYGNAVGGPVGEWTLLRLARTHTASENRYTAWTSNDEGATWDEAGVWTTPLTAAPPRLGLVSMAAAGFTTTFDYVRVYGEQPGRGHAGAAAGVDADPALGPTVELAATGAPPASTPPALAALGLLAVGGAVWVAARARRWPGRSVPAER
jgi:arabinan endo-1,5-alpha-L-arabinosidase